MSNLSHFLELKAEFCNSRILIPGFSTITMPERVSVGELYSRIFWMANHRVLWLPPANFGDNLYAALPEHISQVRDQLDIKYLNVEKYNGETSICSLCLEEITKDSDIYKLQCNHIFHAQNCIGEQNIMVWIKEHGTCPYCRAKTYLSEPEI